MMIDRLAGNAALKDSVRLMLGSRRLTHSVLLVGETGLGAGYAARCVAADYLYPAGGAPAEALLRGECCRAVGKAGDRDSGRIETGVVREAISVTGMGSGGRYLVSQVKAMRTEIFNTSLSAEGRAVLLYHVERMNEESANALLKVMEEPPEGVLFLLTADSLAGVLPTIRSRCISFAVAPVSPEECARWCIGQGVDKKQARLYSELFDGHIGTVLAAARDDARREQVEKALTLAKAAAAHDSYAAAVLLDGDGKLADVMLDELEVEVTADGKGVVTMPTDYRTKRQKGDDYPLAAASSLKKGWAEQADDFADYLTGMTPEQASMLETDKDGKATDADLLSGCTIRVDRYRDAVAKACANAAALGAAKGDRVSLGVEAENASSDITATDDKDVNAEVDLTVVALTLDADGRVTSAIGDMAEPALTIAADGGVTAPDTVRSKLELGDSYGMRNASSLGKEWYEHSEGYCSYLKGKTEKEVADIPADGSDADLAALCTISIDALQKAAGDAFENASL
jgi:DNA polymerase-3 subunit delta'